MEVLPCGHIYCEGCFDSLKEKLCAVCRVPISSTRSPNRTLINLSLNVITKCQNCGWTGRREASFSHTCTAADVERYQKLENAITEGESTNEGQSDEGVTTGTGTPSLIRGSTLWRSKVASIRRSQRRKRTPDTTDRSSTVPDSLPTSSHGAGVMSIITSSAVVPTPFREERLVSTIPSSHSSAHTITSTLPLEQRTSASSTLTYSAPPFHPPSGSQSSYDTNAMMSYLFHAPHEMSGGYSGTGTTSYRVTEGGNAGGRQHGDASHFPSHGMTGRPPTTCTTTATATEPSSSAVSPGTRPTQGDSLSHAASHFSSSDQSNPYGLSPRSLERQRERIQYYQQQHHRQRRDPTRASPPLHAAMTTDVLSSSPVVPTTNGRNTSCIRPSTTPASLPSSSPPIQNEWPYTPTTHLPLSSVPYRQSTIRTSGRILASTDRPFRNPHPYTVIQPPPHHPKPWTFYNLTQEEYDQIVSLFVFFDTDEKGDLNRRELSRLARWLNFARTEEEVDRIFLSMDLSGDGSLSLAEFLTWLRFNKPNPQDLYGLSQAEYNTIMMQFQMYDVDQDGLLNLTDFVRLVMHLGDVRQPEEGAWLFSLVDGTHSGTITLHEFLLFRVGSRRRT